jgi:transcription initiation factor TFIID subunit TAF12
VATGSARIRAHHSNIDRYRMLLTTNLSDLERQFIERRLVEEQQAAEELATRRRLQS